MGEVVKIPISKNDIGWIYLIDDVLVGASHSVVISISIKKYDDKDTSIEASILFYNTCRFEFSDFRTHANNLKTRSTSLLTGIEGFKKISTSEYLEDTKEKYSTEYSQNKDLSHYVLFDETNLVQIVSDSAPKVIFKNDIHASEFNAEKLI